MRKRNLLVSAAAAVVLAAGTPAVASAGTGAGGSAGGTVRVVYGHSAGSSGQAGEWVRPVIGYKQARNRSLYQIERQRGYGPARARYLARWVANRIYGGISIYDPLGWQRVFYAR